MSYLIIPLTLPLFSLISASSTCISALAIQIKLCSYGARTLGRYAVKFNDGNLLGVTKILFVVQLKLANILVIVIFIVFNRKL